MTASSAGRHWRTARTRSSTTAPAGEPLHMMSNAARPGSVLTEPDRLSKETADRLKTENDGNSSERFAKTAVLVPPFLLADATRTTFASAALSYFASQTIRPQCVGLERSFRASALSSRYRLQFDLTAPLPADPDAFAGSLLKLRQADLVTANEGRAMLGLPAHADGESITPPRVMSGKAESASAEPRHRRPEGVAHRRVSLLATDAVLLVWN